MKQITIQKPAEARQCHCAELERDLVGGWSERGSVRRPVEEFVVRKELSLLRKWYQEWQTGPRTTCFCEFVKRRLRSRGWQRGWGQ